MEDPEELVDVVDESMGVSAVQQWSIFSLLGLLAFIYITVYAGLWLHTVTGINLAITLAITVIGGYLLVRLLRELIDRSYRK